MVELLRGKVETVDLGDEMERSYMEYAMSVIVGRALPDARDGLKPVHRRILYSMYESGLSPTNPYRKCARVVGDVMGRYHPHGDAAIYDALARLAQDFSCRYELVDGHGNFGSVDGDSPAAMRYTECRLSPIAMEMLSDIHKETVEFVDNYDGSMKEPTVLPAKFPNLLVNGSSGIAVGMATNIPTHNLGEVSRAIIATIDKPDISLEEIMEILPGPDFPTGGLIMGREGIEAAYRTGRGTIVMRARVHTEKLKGDRQRIAVTELPYQVNKARLTEKIAELTREKTIAGISDLRDESDRSGMRLVIELKKEAEPELVLNQLYKHTQMQTSFGAIMLALVGGVPKTLTLLDLIRIYIEHRKEIVTRRTQFELKKAEAREHILKGLLIAIQHIDEVISLIKASPNVEAARDGLMKKFHLTEPQAQAVLDMKLSRLTNLERTKVKEELAQLAKQIAEFKETLADPAKVLAVIKEELTEMSDKFSDDRRTRIVGPAGELTVEDLIAEEEMAITITHSGYVKRVPLTTFRKQKRGGRGVAGMDLKEGDFIEHLFITSTHHFILFFTNKGKVYRLKVYELPTGSRTAKGKAIVNLLPLEPGEGVKGVIATKDFGGGRFLICASRKGMVKKTPFESYDSARSGGIIALKLLPDDELISVRLTSGDGEIMLVSRNGQAIRFGEKQCRPMGRVAAGVRGMRLDKGDEVVSMETPDSGADLLVVTEEGYGKRTPVSEYPLRGRGGKGVKTIALTERRGLISAALIVRDNQEILVASEEGIVIRVPTSGIPRTKRATQGARIMRLGKGDKVSAAALVVSGDESGKENDVPAPDSAD